MATQTCYVTGATGFIGAHVARALVARGDRVRCLVRANSRRDALEGVPVELVTGDVNDERALREGMAGASLVFHLAADYRLYAPDPEELYRTNVEGTRKVLAAAASAGVERVVYTSSVATLGIPSDGGTGTEETPSSLDDMIGVYKRSKFLAEQEARRWARDRMDVVIVNPAAPIGELDIKPTPTGEIIVDFLRGRMVAFVETGLNLVDVRDVAMGHLLAAERGTRGQRYILGHRNVTLEELFQILAGLSNVRAPRLRLPHFVPIAVAALEAPLARLRGKSPRVPLDAARMARKKMFFDAGKAVRELGLPQSPIEPALARAVGWFRERGYVAA